MDLREGDKIVILGNTMAERLAMSGCWEPLLQNRFPERRLIVRNLGWSADEVALRPRSKDFDQHGHELADHKPQIIIAMFGLNESFQGEAGLDAFREDLLSFASEVTSTSYDGSRPVQLVLCSPTPHEDLRDPHLPTGESTNANIQLYSEVMASVAAEVDGCSFVDLFHPMRDQMQVAETPLTINGIHFNEAGNRILAQVLDQQLFGEAPALDAARYEALRAAVVERNRQFYFDYHAVNGYYIYGGRKNPYGVVNFPEEFAKLRKMISNRDERIWKIAAGQSVPAEIDDSNTGVLSPVVTNVTGDIRVSDPEESLQKFIVPDGFTVELVASEVEFPDLENPVAFEFDNRGRLWVSTMPSYPMYLPGQPPNDKILILEDQDGDGRMDKQTVFADGLHLPIGFSLGDGGAYVSQQPNLLFLKDTDGDDRADMREIILHGFDSADSHHSISAFTWGPGGGIYFQEGTFHHTQVETPYGPRRVKDAGIFRFEPTTQKFDIFVSYPFANPWGHCFDKWGQNFVADASPGANYFGTAFSGDVIYPNKRRGMKQFLVKQWRPTCGCVIVSSRQFPASMQGNYLLNNTIGFLGTLQYRMRETGSGFAADPVEPLLSSKDPNFRPVDLTFGPDGALYLVDWFNPLIGHMQHSLRDPNRDKHHGRIWRVRYTKKPLLQPPVIDGEAIENLVPLLGSYEDATRSAVRNELRRHPFSAIAPVLDRWLDSLEQDPDPDARQIIEHAHLEALWVRQHHHAVDRAALLRLLKSPEFRARAAATRVLGYWRDEIEDASSLLVAMAKDEHPRVRLEAVRAASFFPAEEGRPVVAAAMRMPLDDYLNYTIGETTTTLDRRAGNTSSTGNAVLDSIAGSVVPQTQLADAVELAARTATAGELARMMQGILAGPYESSIKAIAIQHITDAARARKLSVPVNAAPFLSAFQQAVRDKRWSLVSVLADAGGNWQVAGFEPLLRAVVFDAESDGNVVLRALQALTMYSTPTSSDALSSLMRQEIPLPLALRAAAALAVNRNGQAKRLFRESLLRDPQDYQLVKHATNAWLQKQGGERQLLEILRQTDVPPDAAKLVLRAVQAFGASNPELTNRLTELSGIDSQKTMTPAERRSLIDEILQHGDPEAGQWVFRRSDLQCAQCHALTGAGGNVGPDLSGVGATSPAEYLLDSILTPSQQIKEAFATINVLTVNGQILRGIQLNRDDQRLVLLDAEGKRMTIPVDDIEAESEGPSLMPEGIHHLMTRRELVDLVAFLGQLGKPGPYAINSRPTIQKYEWLADESILEKLVTLPEGELETTIQDVSAEAWRSIYALVDGKLPTADITKVDPELPVILRGRINVVAAGELAVRVAPTERVQVLLDGKSISPSGQESRSLDAGPHQVELIYEKGTPPELLTTEFVKPSESQVQFSVVGGL